MARLIWTRLALRRLRDTYTYIRDNQSDQAAKMVVNKLLQRPNVLLQHPLVGAKEPLLAGKKYEYRRLLQWNWKLVYRVEGDTIYIVTLVHMAQDLKTWEAELA